MLVLSGCSSKEPAIDASTNAQSSTQGTASTQSGSATSENGSNVSSTVIAPVSNTAATSDTANANTGTNGSDGSLVSILFDFDKYNIREDMQEAMNKNTQLLNGKTIKLEGNCDEFGSDEYNYALGLKRANTVKSALVEGGINPDAVSMTSLGEGNPVCLEKTPECWAKNRRVDFKLP